MPVYNGAPFLRETLDAVVAQSFEDWELIISDNASTDAGGDICRSFAASDPRIRYVRNAENIGIARNFNRVFELAGGEYFKLATADDLCGRVLVEKCVNVLDRQPEVVLCYGKTTLIDERGGTLGPYEDGLDLRMPGAVERFRVAADRIRRVHVLQGLMRARALRRTGLLGRYLGSDVVLVLELTLHGQFYEFPERLFFRRIHAHAFNSLTPLEREQQNVDPDCNVRESLYYWRQYREYVRAIGRSPVTFVDKLRLLREVARVAARSRRTLAREAVDSMKAVLGSR
jgi:glycosyltransferase involved in cell wall biosynthesis